MQKICHSSGNNVGTYEVISFTFKVVCSNVGLDLSLSANDRCIYCNFGDAILEKSLKQLKTLFKVSIINYNVLHLYNYVYCQHSKYVLNS